MKKLLLIALLALTFSAGAQVTYIGEVEGELEYNLYSTLPADRYLVYSGDGWDIYNPDLTLHKSFHGLPSGERVTCFTDYLGKHAVNDDEKYEFIVIKFESTTTGNGDQSTYTVTTHLYIYNEDGDVLYTFPDVSYYNITGGGTTYSGKSLYRWTAHLIDGELRVALIYRDYDESEERTKIYKFNGRPDMEDIVEVPEAGVRSMPAFPNPTRGEVTLPYTLPQGERATMQIFDMSGRLIEQRPISGEGRMVKVDVSAYAPGVYLYEYKGQTNRFVVR